MILNTLPRRIRYIPASAIFTAAYNSPTIGKYDFAGLQQVFITNLLPNTVYFIDSVSFAGTVASEDYLSALDIIPIFTLRKSLANEIIFDLPLPVQAYANDSQISHYFKTGLNNCALIASMTGRLSQIPDFVGITKIQLSVSLNIHAIDESDFEQTFTKQG